MSDIIHLLPDSVANQIAAGEVVQRPASVVKEMVENAIDAGATKVTINLKDAGRTLIQVIDNGKGMSPTDARISFERHATSKIQKAEDLFAIRSMGFRGEALASIAAVSEIELKTRKEEDQIGTHIQISASEVSSQEEVVCERGCNFTIKNLFYNIPARRKFLKSDRAELKHIMVEVQRIALSHHDVSFRLYHNDSIIYDLPMSNLRKRIVNLLGKNINQNLIPVEVETSIIKITGYIGQPKFARKTSGDQFFFVNQRYMRHPYFHKAITNAYENIIASDTIPAYFLFFEVDPQNIDVNIHPTKTEIKFEDEKSAWHIIHAAVRESLGKFNIVPSIEFDQSGAIDIPALLEQEQEDMATPAIEVDQAYNPFDISRSVENNFRPTNQVNNAQRFNNNRSNWNELYNGVETEKVNQEIQANLEAFEMDIPDAEQNEPFFNQQGDAVQQTLDIEEDTKLGRFLHLKNKYILTPVKSGLMVIDQRKAHQRILYEGFLQLVETQQTVSQQQLFPHTIELGLMDGEVLKSILDELNKFGFDIQQANDHGFIINGIPSILGKINPVGLLERIIEEVKGRPFDIKEEINNYVAKILAKTSCIHNNKAMKDPEVEQLFNDLFCCSHPTISPWGDPVLKIMALDDLDKFLK
ncbi:DNA mismatch repair endonuclease MutL [Halosquirtibacter xylanolyticus]|uniref:DNA mismatch repair endonuclease MutL n=1 Tax=Halosquirtibacter xylanolyticus TaxID=3374599 RepID=UPI003748F16B|nr:DNA mismatch repair endonuclease MutL [Prolixibacteraceae bacterium]